MKTAPSGIVNSTSLCPDSRFLVFFCVACMIPPFEASISHWKHKFQQHPLFPRPTGLERETVVSWAVFSVHPSVPGRNTDIPHETEKKLKKLQEQHEDDIRKINEEQCLITYGLLACLKGLQEKGCNGPVTEAINRIQKHLNKQAHDMEE